MAVFRVKKNSNYTVMSNYHLRDKYLSYKAKGLLSFMLSLPDDWDYSMNGLVAVSKENIKAIRSTIKELEDNHYLIRNKIHADKGKYDYEYLIYEYPYTHLGYTEEENTVNGIKINTKLMNKEENKEDKNKLIKILIKSNFINEKDIDIYRYEDLFSELLKDYLYEVIYVLVKYILNHWYSTKGLDENDELITDKYNYFKASLYNNILKLNIKRKDEKKI